MFGLPVTVIVLLFSTGVDEPLLTDDELAAELARVRAELAATRREAERMARWEAETRKLVDRVEQRLRQHGIRTPDQAISQPAVPPRDTDPDPG